MDDEYAELTAQVRKQYKEYCDAFFDPERSKRETKAYFEQERQQRMKFWLGFVVGVLVTLFIIYGWLPGGGGGGDWRY